MKFRSLIIALVIPLLVGGLSSFLTSEYMNVYKDLNLPGLAPPGSWFPVIWTVLFVLMGISSYFIYNSSHKDRENALLIYSFQLFINFTWPLFFFNMQKYFLSAMILIVLIVLVIVMLVLFYRIKPISCYLNIPYLFWLLFALYLNFFIFINN